MNIVNRHLPGFRNYGNGSGKTPGIVLCFGTGRHPLVTPGQNIMATKKRIDTMRYKKTGSLFILRIDRGEEIVTTLKQFCTEQEISLGTVQGIGAINNAVIGLFATATKEYHTVTLSGDHEITSLIGNISTMDKQIYLHLHATLSDASHRAFGGHLTSAIVSGTCEIFIHTIDGRVDRTFDAGVGLNVFDL